MAEAKKLPVYTVASSGCGSGFYRYVLQLGAAFRRMGHRPLIVEASGGLMEEYSEGFEPAPIEDNGQGGPLLWLNGRVGYMRAGNAGEAMDFLSTEDLAFDTILFVVCQDLSPEAVKWEYGQRALLLVRPDYDGIIEAYNLLKMLADTVSWVGLLCQAQDNNNMTKTVLDNVVKTASQRLSINLKAIGLTDGDCPVEIIPESVWLSLEWLGIYKEKRAMPVPGLPRPLAMDSWVDFTVDGTKYFGRVLRIFPPDIFRVELEPALGVPATGEAAIDIHGGMFSFGCRPVAGWYEVGRNLMEFSVLSQAKKVERRSAMRLAVWLPIAVYIEDKQVDGHTEDISVGGIRIVLKQKLDTKTQYRMRVDFDHKEFIDLTCRVVRSVPLGKSYRISLMFVDKAKGTDERIIKQIFRLEVMRKGVVQPIE